MSSRRVTVLAWVAAERARADQLRRATTDMKEAERLVQRVNHLRDLPSSPTKNTAMAITCKRSPLMGLGFGVTCYAPHPTPPVWD